MPVHDFHPAWLWAIRRGLNTGLLPRGYDASVEQHIKGFVPNVATLYAAASGPGSPAGGVALAEPRRRATVALGFPTRDRLGPPS